MNSFASLGQPPRIAPPYPPWPHWLVATIEAAIREAGRRIVATHSPAAIHAADENELSNWLQRELWQLLDAAEANADFSHQVFDKPTRGAEVENFDGTRVSKKPDLSFYRHGNPAGVIDGRHNAWFCECKILDAAHDRNDYIHLGLMRFVEGDYAWAMPAAQMIAYVRHTAADGWLPASRLPTYMAGNKPSAGKTHAALSAMTLSTAEAGDILATTHGRRFPLRTGKSPGDIVIRHLWLQMA